MTSSSTLSRLGISSNQTITFSDDSTINVDGTTTMAQLVSGLQGKGVTASYNDATGVLSIGDASDALAVQDMSSDLETHLELMQVQE